MLNSKKMIFIGIMIISIIVSLGMLTAADSDNIGSDQISTEDTSQDIQQSNIIQDTNTKEQITRNNQKLNSKSETKTEKRKIPGMEWLYEEDPTYPDPDVGQFDIWDDDGNIINNNTDDNSSKTEKTKIPGMEWLYEEDPTYPDPDVGQFDIWDDDGNVIYNNTKEIKNIETNNKIYTVSNATQLIETIDDIVANQSEDYNYILNLKDGIYVKNGIYGSKTTQVYNINTTKNLNITLKGNSLNTKIDLGSFIIAPSVKLTITNINNSQCSIENYGTCILNNVKFTTYTINSESNSLYNKGKMIIRNSNLTLESSLFEERPFYTDYNLTPDFYLYVKGGLNNDGLLEIENTTFNNSFASEQTNFITDYYEDDSNHNNDFKIEFDYTTGKCNSKGGVIFNNGTIRINNTRFLNTNAQSLSSPRDGGKVDGFGGAIYNMGNISINNSIFKNNSVISHGNGYGGAIYNIGNLNITKTVFSDVKVKAQGESKGFIIYNNGTLNVTNSVLSSKNNETIPLIYSENKNTTVENNWWGSNNPEWTRLLKNVETPENWIFLRVQTSKDKLISTEEMKITYDFNWLTNGNKTIQAQGNMPDNTAVSGKSELGKISENTTKNGNTQTTYTAIKKGTDNLKVMVEQDEIQTPINITISPIATITKITSITKNVSVNEKLEIKAKITDINNKIVNTGYMIIKIDGITQKNQDKTDIKIPVENGTIKYTMKIDDKFDSKIHNLTLKYMPNEQYIESSSSAVFNLSKPTYPIINVNSYTAFTDALNSLKQQTLNPYSIATINFTRGNYNLTQTVNWQNATYKILRIYGNGNLVDANHKQFITVAEGYTLELYNFKIRCTQSERGSVIYNNRGTINIYDSIFLNCTATKNGGVIYNDHGKVKILNSSFSNNVAENGAVIYNNNGFINETKSYFSFNTAKRGGVNYNIGETIIIKSTYKNNNAKINGGVNFNDKNKLTITNSNLLNNKATKYGGCNYNNINAKINITATQITNNTAENGGANANYGSLTIKSSNLNQNKATRGGCNYNYKNLEIIKSTFKNNQATRNAAVNYNDHGKININDSTFKENTAKQNGGCNYNNNGNMTINNTKNINNTATRGGCNYNNKGNITITNTQNHENIATRGGCNYNNKGSITMENTENQKNTAKQDGGCNYNNNGNMTINNTKNMNNIATRGGVNYNLKGILTIENTNSTSKDININYNEKGIMKNKNSEETYL